MAVAREYITIGEYTFNVPEKNLRKDDITYRPRAAAISRQDLSFSRPEPYDVLEQHDWSGGGGKKRLNLDDPEDDRYFTAKNMDLSIPGVAFPSQVTTAFKTTAGAALGALITHWIEYKGNLFAFGGTVGYYWDTTGGTLPNVFTLTGPTVTTLAFPATITDVIVYGGTLFVAMGESNAFVYTTDSTPAAYTDWVAATGSGNNPYATYWTVLNNTLYKAINKTGSSTFCGIYGTTDVVNSFTWSATVSAGVGNNSYNITNLISYEGSLLVMKENGIFEIDTNGTLYSVAEELDNFPTATNGAVCVQHGGVVYFKLREGLSAWAGSSILGVSTRIGLQLVGPDSIPDMDADDAGTPLYACSAPPWLFLTMKGHDGNYYVKKAAPEGNGRGFHPWLFHSTTALGGIFYFARSTTNPLLCYGLGTTGNYVIMPRYTDNPLDDSSCTFQVASCEVTTPRFPMGPLAYDKKQAACEVWVANCDSSTRKISVYYGLNGAATTTFLGDITTSGIITIPFPTGANTVTAREIQYRFVPISSSATTVPLIYSWKAITKLKYPALWQWLIDIPARPDVDHQHRIGSVLDVEKALEELRDTDEVYKFTDHYGREWDVTFERFSKQGDSQQAGGPTQPKEPSSWFQVQLEQWIGTSPVDA